MAILCAARAALSAPAVSHQPPLEAAAGQPVQISAIVTDPQSPVQQVKLFYRTGGTLGYRMLLMTGAGYHYSAVIPGQAVLSAGLEYYIEARSQNGLSSSSPPITPQVAPHRLPVRVSVPGPAFTLLSPENGGRYKPEEVVLVVRIDMGSGQPDLATLTLMLDGRDVTQFSQISESMIAYVPEENLAEGPHNVSVRLRNREGVEGKSPVWSFTVNRKAPPAFSRPEVQAPAKGWQFSGALNTQLQYAAICQEPSAEVSFSQPREWLNRFNCNFSGKSDGLDVFGTVFLTSEDKPERQPVDRVRLEFFNPGFSLALGDLYPAFTPLSVNQAFLRGGQVSLTSGAAQSAHSQFEAAGGLTRLPLEGREPNVSGVYEQWLWAARWLSDFWPGAGLSVNYCTVNGYANSIRTPAGALPASNHAATADAHARIDWQRDFSTRIYGEYGYSYYDETQNLLSISLGDALRGGMRWEWNQRNYAQLEYRRIGSNYVTLANPWLVGDWEGISGDTQFFLLGDSLNLTGAVEIWRDNINGQKSQTYLDAANTTVTAGTTRTQFISAVLNSRPWDWMPMLTAGLALNRQQDDSKPAPVVDNQLTSFNLGLGLQLPAQAGQWQANATLTQSQYQDLAGRKVSGDTLATAWLVSLMYLPGSDWLLGGGCGYTQNQTNNQGVSGYLGGPLRQTAGYTLMNLRAGWKAVPGRLDLSASWDTLAGKDDAGLADNLLVTHNLSGTYYLEAAQSLGLSLANIGYTDRVHSGCSYAELVISLKYGVQF